MLSGNFSNNHTFDQLLWTSVTESSLHYPPPLIEDKVSLLLEVCMVILFLLSSAYGVVRYKRNRVAAAARQTIDLKDVESVLCDAVEQCQHENLSKQHCGRLQDKTT